MTDGFEEIGRLWLRGAVPPDDLQAIRALTSAGRPGERLRGSGVLARVLGAEGPVGSAIARLWPGMRPVRVVAFAKDEGANWGVPWHQDRVIAVAERVEGADATNWSRKDGVWHCEPAPEVLGAMLFVRVHLDPSTPWNGPMEVALGSHHLGVVPAPQTAEAAARLPQEACLAGFGDVLVLKMLTLHRSRPAEEPAPRRVLRVDYASRPLPGGLAWAGP